MHGTWQRLRQLMELTLQTGLAYSVSQTEKFLK